MKGSHTFPGGALLLALILAGPGCGKKGDAPAPTPAAQAKGGVSVDGANDAAPPPPASDAPAAAAAPAGGAPAVDDTQTVQAPGTLPQPEVMLRIIAKYNAQFGRPPASVDDLVRAGFMNKLPTLDTSLKYKLDVQAGTLEIVNK